MASKIDTCTNCQRKDAKSPRRKKTKKTILCAFAPWRLCVKSGCNILDASEIDVAVFDIGVDEFDGDIVADIEALEAMDELAFDRRSKEAHPSAFHACTSDHRFKGLSQLRGKNHCSSR